MRLIDADALNKELQMRVGSPTDDKLYEVNLCIIASPTIDAIPVEWLREKMKIPTMTCANPFDYVFCEWMNEQEAQDG